MSDFEQIGKQVSLLCMSAKKVGEVKYLAVLPCGDILAVADKFTPEEEKSINEFAMHNRKERDALSAVRGENFKQALIEARDVSQQVVNRWHTPAWKDVEATAKYIQRLEQQITKINKVLGE